MDPLYARIRLHQSVESQEREWPKTPEPKQRSEGIFQPNEVHIIISWFRTRCERQGEQHSALTHASCSRSSYHFNSPCII